MHRDLPWLLLLWAGVAAILLLRLTAQIKTMNRAVARADPLHERRWRDLLSAQIAQVGMRNPVDLRRGDAIQMPSVWGILRPVIVLPATCELWSDERRRMVLTHELAHIARRDLPVLMLGKVASAIHWFNPLAWWLNHRLSKEREHACDDTVLTLGLDAEQYAEELLEIAAAHSPKPQAAPLMAAQSDLEERIMAILDPQQNRRRTSSTTRTILSGLFALTVVPMAAATGAASTEGASNIPDIAGKHGQSDTASFRSHLDALDFEHASFEMLLSGLRSASALTRAACAWRLGQRDDPRAVEPLMEATRDDDARVRQWATRSLGDLRDAKSVPPLIDRLDDKDAEVRQWATRSLGDLRDAKSVPPLIDRLDDKDAEVREWAARALGAIGDRRAVDPLANALQDNHPEVREWAARSLGDLGDLRAVPSLLKVARDPDDNVREWVVRSLGELGDPRAIEPVKGALDDENVEVRTWAVRSLGNLYAPRRQETWRTSGPEPLMPGIGQTSTLKRADDPETVQRLVRFLNQAEDPEETEHAIGTLASLGDQTAVIPVIERLGSPHHAVREWAARALGTLGDPRAVPPLIDLLNDGDTQVREWAVRSLGVLRDARMVQPLIERLDDGNAVVRQWAVRALGAYGDARAIAPIHRRLADDDDTVRRWARTALDQLQPRWPALAPPP